jgi:hypothetical protein
MSEIIIDKDDPEMELDPDELALLEEVEIDPRPAKTPRGVRRRHPVVHRQEVETMDAFMNPNKTSAPPPQHISNDEPIDYHENDMDDADVFVRGAPPPDDHQGGFGESQGPSQGFASLDDEKADILNKLTRLSQKKGIHINRRLNMYSDIDELRAELKRAKYSIDVEQSIKFSRRALVACITGLEFLNKRYDPFDLKLDGWSESIMENIEDYDEPFEELYVKYKSSAKVPPEVKLIMMVGGSGMMFHLTNSMFKSVMPNVNDILRQNPDLAQTMMGAVQNTMQANAQGTPPPPRREMKGPGFDLSSLMGNLATPMPPQPVNTYSGDISENQEEMLPDDDISDIVSVVSHSDEVKDVSVKPSGTKRRGRKKKVEATI